MIKKIDKDDTDDINNDGDGGYITDDNKKSNNKTDNLMIST